MPPIIHVQMIGLAVTDELMDETHPPIVEFKLSDLQHHVVINEHQQQRQHQKKQEPGNKKTFVNI